MISGHVLVKGSEENIPYATVLIVGSGQGTVSNEEGQFEFKNLPAGKYTLRVSAVGYIWGIERSGFFNGRGKWAKGFDNQRV